MKISYFIVAAFTILALSCGEKEEIKFEKQYEGPLLIQENIDTYFSDSAKTKVHLTSPLEEDYKNGDILFPEGIFIEFYDKDEVLETTLKANSGKYKKESNSYHVQGNVVVDNIKESQKLFSEELNWDPDKQVIYTDKMVRIRTDTEILTGQGLTADQNFTNYTIIKPTGIFTIESDE